MTDSYHDSAAAPPGESVVSPLPHPLASSTDQLKIRVQAFIDRATDIRNHPLAGAQGGLQLKLKCDRETLELIGGTVELDDVDRSSWVHLAVLMRPLVFLEQDPLSFHVLTNAISREHEPLRPYISELKTRFTAWQESNLLGYVPMGDAADPLPEGEHQIESIWTGSVGTLPVDIDEPDIVWDKGFANTFVNGCLWHSDLDKATEYSSASPLMKQFMAKCAELRTLSAVQFVTRTYYFVMAARAVGYDF